MYHLLIYPRGSDNLKDVKYNFTMSVIFKAQKNMPNKTYNYITICITLSYHGSSVIIIVKSKKYIFCAIIMLHFGFNKNYTTNMEFRAEFTNSTFLLGVLLVPLIRYLLILHCYIIFSFICKDLIN